jgi:hypothetical protein
VASARIDKDAVFVPDCFDRRSTLLSEEGEMSLPENSSWKTRLVKRGFPDRSFDIEFWQEQGDEAIFAAAWEMVELAEEINHGGKPTLQRTSTTLKRI